MRCALLVLVALLEAQALRAEPLGERTEDRAGELQMPWDRLPAPKAEDALRRLFGMDAAAAAAADVEDERYDYEKPAAEQLDEAQLRRTANYLLKVLRRPSVYEAPVLLVKEPDAEPGSPTTYPLQQPDEPKSVAKRTRYYRRYPWKRQNSRNYQNLDYDPYNGCTLTRKDVFKLLVALHDARQGNKSRVVNFCNRRRPASAVYTNIRFLGRRRK